MGSSPLKTPLSPRTLSDPHCFTFCHCLAVSVWFCNLPVNLQERENREINHYNTRNIRWSFFLKPQHFQLHKKDEIVVMGSWWDRVLLWLLRIEVHNQRVIRWERFIHSISEPVRQKFPFLPGFFLGKFCSCRSNQLRPHILVHGSRMESIQDKSAHRTLGSLSCRPEPLLHNVSTLHNPEYLCMF